MKILLIDAGIIGTIYGGTLPEVQVFFYDLLNTGRNLGVEMPVMSSFEPDIQNFATSPGKL